MSDAVVLAGAVARGAFEAGALRALACHVCDLEIVRIVATSAGALNGVFLARELAAGRGDRVGDELEKLWIERATLAAIASPTAAGALALDGVTTSDKLRELLRAYVLPVPHPVRPIDLRIVVSVLEGRVSSRPWDAPGTTYEHVVRFSAADFATSERLERVFDAVTASAAFPLLFRPVPLFDEHGERMHGVDGGAVNNAPIKHAVEGADIDRVFVLSPVPRVVPKQAASERGPAYVGLLADILINERLFRDLREVCATNHALARLAEVLPTEHQRARVLEAIGWSNRRTLEVVEVRPSVPLEGSSFSGLVSRELREAYVQAGRDAAEAALASR